MPGTHRRGCRRTFTGICKMKFRWYQAKSGGALCCLLDNISHVWYSQSSADCCMWSIITKQLNTSCLDCSMHQLVRVKVCALSVLYHLCVLNLKLIISIAFINTIYFLDGYLIHVHATVPPVWNNEEVPKNAVFCGHLRVAVKSEAIPNFKTLILY